MGVVVVVVVVGRKWSVWGTAVSNKLRAHLRYPMTSLLHQHQARSSSPHKRLAWRLDILLQ